jgi:hypothetical protein
MTLCREIVESPSETGKHSHEGTEAYLKQYVDGLSGEHARRLACRSGESAIAAEAFMNNAGYGFGCKSVINRWNSGSDRIKRDAAANR